MDINEFAAPILAKRQQEQLELAIALMESPDEQVDWEWFLELDALDPVIEDPTSEIRRLIAKRDELILEQDEHWGKGPSWEIWDGFERYERHDAFLESRIKYCERQLLNLLRGETKKAFQ